MNIFFLVSIILSYFNGFFYNYLILKINKYICNFFLYKGQSIVNDSYSPPSPATFKLNSLFFYLD